MPSEMDKLFEELFGFLPNKKGSAFEMLVAAVRKMDNPELDVKWNQNIRGTFSGTVYQIDALVTDEANQREMVEAKDYTLRKQSPKVGRPDLQKLAGALRDLGLQSGSFASATDYTTSARKYANASTELLGIPIILSSVEEVKDTDGRLLAIKVTIVVSIPILEKASFCPEIHPRGHESLQRLVGANKVAPGYCQLVLDEIYKGPSKEKVRVADIARSSASDGQTEVYATWLLPEYYIRIADEFVEIRGISYKAPVSRVELEFEITTNGEPKVVFRSNSSSKEKVFTDADFQRVKFCDDGTVGLQ